MMACCSKTICKGCEFANSRRQLGGRLDLTCPFCRHPFPETEEEGYKINFKRAEANDPVAIAELGGRHCREGEYDTAFEYLTKAAGLGDINAHYDLSRLYEKDEKKGLYHLEEAVIAGHPEARFRLGCIEGRHGRIDRMVEHFIISANLGHDESIEVMKLCYKEGRVSKEDFASALRAHQAAVNETKSPQREEASKAWQRQKPREQKK